MADSHCADTVGVSRPVGAGETDTYCNKVAPTARIYLHLICRKRHLPLKLRKGKTMTKPRLRTVVLTAAIDATGGTGKPVPYRVRCKKAASYLCSARQLWFFMQFPVGMPEISVSVGVSIRSRKTGDHAGEFGASCAAGRVEDTAGAAVYDAVYIRPAHGRDSIGADGGGVAEAVGI